MLMGILKESFNEVETVIMTNPDMFDPGQHRLFKNTRYAMQGLVAVFLSERAFRLEVLMVVALAILACWLPLAFNDRLLLLSILFVPLLVELLNSAIERVVDLASPAYHELAKQAKDAASAAVFISLLLVAVVWLGVLYRAFVLNL